MKLEEIIDALNKQINTKREADNKKPIKLVVHKVVMPSNVIKAYKQAVVSIYCLENRKRTLITTTQVTDKIFTGQEDMILDRLSIKTLLDFFNILKDNKLDKIIEENEHRA